MIDGKDCCLLLGFGLLLFSLYVGLCCGSFGFGCVCCGLLVCCGLRLWLVLRIVCFCVIRFGYFDFCCFCRGCGGACGLVV